MPLRSRKGKWHYRFCVHGQEYTGSTGLVATERNKNAAMRAEAKARELVTAGRGHELRLEIKPFSDAATEFLSWAEGEHADHPNTAKRLRTSFASLTKFFGKTPVLNILRGHINDFKAWRRKEHGVREITLRHDLHALSKAFKYFVDHNWVRDNPVRAVEIPSDKDAVRMRILTASEEALYFETVRARFPALHDVGRLMLNQGCRPEEILALRVEDIDLERSRLVIRAGKSAAARRTLRLTTASREICAARVAASTKARSPWLFPGRRPGTHLSKLNGAHNAILDSLATCGCGHRRSQHTPNGFASTCPTFNEASRLAFVMYDFRHTFATRAAETGMPVATLAAILGHADLRSVVKYVHVRQEAQDRAMEDFERAQELVAVEARSGFGPVLGAEKRDFGVTAGTRREPLISKQVI